MPYMYLEEIATADVAFQAWGDTIEQLFTAAADATTNLMVDNLDSICNCEKHRIDLADTAIDMLLFQVLQELIFLKDAHQLLVRLHGAVIIKNGDRFTFHAEAWGEVLTPQKHHLAVDVKAVTLHRFNVKKSDSGWEAFVVLDI